MKALVAIVGRPNVGKSTLFNRLAGRRLAIVEDVPGVTRDRHYADVEWEGRDFTVIDTGGFVPGESDPLLQAVREQAQLAIEECDVILFVVDGRAGVIGADEEVASVLRKSGKPVLLCVNKLDDDRTREALSAEFHRLGFSEVLGMSAEHGRGIDVLRDDIVARLPPAPPAPEGAEEAGELEGGEEEDGEEGGEERERRGKGRGGRRKATGPVRVAIVGRPNVGKSTLVNAMLKKNRMVASPTPGTTRDPIDSEVVFKDRKFILTDTAGIRRKKAIAQRVEAFTVVAALRVIDDSDVAVVLLDATEPAVDQDIRLAGIADEKGRALIIVVNKWDLVARMGGNAQEKLRDDLKYRLKFVSYAPIVFTSALTGSKVDKVMELAIELHAQYHFRAPTPRLNKLLEWVTDNHPAPIISGRQLRLYYIAQVGTAPPSFAVTTNKPGGVPDAYKRYLVNQIRDTFDLRVPIRIFFRERPGGKKRASRKRPT